MKKRISVALVSAMLAVAGTAPVQAQDNYPSKEVTIVVPYSPGGIADTFTRAVADRLADKLGQPVIVDNRPGASQMVGAMAVVEAPADGYTLFLGSTTSLAVNVHTQKNLRYDPVKDFAPVTLGMTMPLFLVVNPEVPANSVEELIAMLRADPGKYTFASIGNGSSTHMAGEMFMQMTGTDMVHVPYKGSTPAIADLVAGRVTMNFDVGKTSLPLVESGQLKVLAVGSKDRYSQLPDLPTVSEAGVPGYQASVWFGFVTTAGTPQPIVDRLSKEIGDILRTDKMKATFAPSAIELTPDTPAEFGEMIQGEIDRWGEVLRKAGLEPK
ncbi:MAG: tripartite tricarboxylate transporter substrate binding protein [Rhodobacteraceae bacterium]|nr:tripartite tricarboxylate transporter substrate binding protein [Paracoccaceae bacterium]